MKFEGKQWEYFKWFLFLLSIFLLYKLLNKFGILGMTDDERGAAELEKSKVLDPNLASPETKSAIKLATGKANPTAADIKKLCPNQGSFAKWILDIKYAKGKVNDDEDPVFNVFRSLYSQFEVKMFATVFKATTGLDLMGYLDSMLNDEEMAKINSIIKNKKPS